MAILKTKGQGCMESYPYPVKEDQRYIITSTLAAFLFSSQPKGKGIERLI